MSAVTEFDFTCPHRVFSCQEKPDGNPHGHCARCNTALPAEGGGGDDGSQVGGYTGGASCANDCDCYLCDACRANEPICPHCLAAIGQL